MTSPWSSVDDPDLLVDATGIEDAAMVVGRLDSGVSFGGGRTAPAAASATQWRRSEDEPTRERRAQHRTRSDRPRPRRPAPAQRHRRRGCGLDAGRRVAGGLCPGGLRACSGCGGVLRTARNRSASSAAGTAGAGRVIACRYVILDVTRSEDTRMFVSVDPAVIR